LQLQVFAQVASLRIEGMDDDKSEGNGMGVAIPYRGKYGVQRLKGFGETPT
jgi:hypothetical protein